MKDHNSTNWELSINPSWRCIILLVCLLSSAGQLKAMTIRVGTLQDSLVAVDPDSTFHQTLTLTNEDVDAFTLLAVQLNLLVEGDDESSSGTISVDSVSMADDSLFMSSIPVLGVQPSPRFVTVGVQLPNPLAMIDAGSTRNLMDLTFSVSADAAGLFYLLATPYVPGDFNATGMLVPPLSVVPFANGTSSGHGENILIATFRVNEDLPGDYNGNDVVDLADYVAWKEQFGAQVTSPGEGADGNRDGTVNLADYTIWRNNLGAAVDSSNESTSYRLAVPEAPTILLGIVCIVAIPSCVRAGRDRNSDIVSGCIIR